MGSMSDKKYFSVIFGCWSLLLSFIEKADSIIDLDIQRDEVYNEFCQYQPINFTYKSFLY